MCPLLVATANAQLSQGIWLVSGSGTYYVQKFKVAGEPTRMTYIEAAPHVGYFVLNRMAAGLKGQWYYWHKKEKYSSVYYTTVGAGPFVRYYFLPEQNRGNLFAESAYQYTPTWGGSGTTDGKADHVYSFSAGPTYYFNSSVGLELALSYQVGKSYITEETIKTSS